MSVISGVMSDHVYVGCICLWLQGWYTRNFNSWNFNLLVAHVCHYWGDVCSSIYGVHLSVITGVMYVYF